MITDPFPQLTAFLGALLLYLIYLGVILSTISAVAAGILFLPIFGHNEQRTSIGSLALRLTAIGFIIIVLAIPARTALLHFFPLPTNLPAIPAIPLSTPTPTPTIPTLAPPGQ